MAFEFILLLVGLICGYLVARMFIQKTDWKDKEDLLNERWNNKVSQLEKTWEVKYVTDIAELKREFKDSEKTIRSNTLSGSRRSLVGKFIERFIPFLQNIPYQPSDMHFLGSPIDYIVFEGLHEDKVNRVTFLEVKTGDSKLTKREESLKWAIQNKKVAWEEVYVATKDNDIPDIENKLSNVE